jgi:uncharacterized protein (DUF305 family)
MRIKIPTRLRRVGAVPMGVAALACAGAVAVALSMRLDPAYASPMAMSMAMPMDSRTADDSGPAGFAAENEAAMNKMMDAMAIKPSGDVDRDFVAMMIPHHQGAIEMAQAELRHGSNEQLRRISQEIIVEQQQEIAAMRLALGQPLPPSVPAPTQTPHL